MKCPSNHYIHSRSQRIHPYSINKNPKKYLKNQRISTSQHIHEHQYHLHTTPHILNLT